MNTDQQTKKGLCQRYRKLLIFLGLLLLAPAVLIILIAYSPRTYQPAQPANPNELSSYLTHKLGPDFYNQVQLDQPFELIIEQEGINDILTRYSWPVQIEGFTVYTPILHLKPDGITLMAQVNFKGLSAILSISAKPYLDSDGKMNVNIRSVYLGALPITPLAQKLAQKFVQEHFDPQDPIESVNYAIVSNQPFDPILYMFSKSARITELTLESGRARLFLTPIQ